MTTFYADLSHHDWDRVKGELSWPSIRAATSPIVCIRATYGDPAGWNRPTYHFRDMASGARAAGFSTIGGYHNLITGDIASQRRQVDWLRRELDAVSAEWAMCDVERYPELMTSGKYPRWSDVLRFQDAWYAVEQRVMAWYLPQWVWSRSDMGHPDLSRLRGPLVASRYPTTVDGGPATVYRAAGGDSGPGWAAYGGKQPAIWQFSSTVNVAGASGNTDVNAYRGTAGQLAALLTGGDMATLDAEDLSNIVARIIGYRDAGQRSFHDQFFGDLVPAVVDKLVPTVAAVAADVAELKLRATGGTATVDVAALAEALRPIVRAESEAAAEAAVRRVLGAVDGATPPAV